MQHESIWSFYIAKLTNFGVNVTMFYGRSCCFAESQSFRAFLWFSNHSIECLVKLSAGFPKNALLRTRVLCKVVSPCSQFMCIYFQEAHGTWVDEDTFQKCISFASAPIITQLHMAYPPLPMRMEKWTGRKQIKLPQKSEKRTPGIKAHYVNMRYSSQNPWKRTESQGTSFNSSTGKEDKQICGSLWPVILTYLELQYPVYK